MNTLRMFYDIVKMKVIHHTYSFWLIFCILLLFFLLLRGPDNKVQYQVIPCQIKKIYIYIIDFYFELLLWSLPDYS